MPAAPDASYETENGLRLVWPEDQVVDHSESITIYSYSFNDGGIKEKQKISSVPMMVQKRGEKHTSFLRDVMLTRISSGL